MALRLGYFAIVMGVLCVLLIMMPDDTSSPAEDKFDYGSQGNPFIGFGTADHQAPRELAISVSGTRAMKAITGQGLANLPRMSPRSEREKTAVETINRLDFKELAGALLVTPDLGSEGRPSTPAVLARLLVDDASCLADNKTEMLDSATDDHPSKSATSERGCAGKRESCYASCLTGLRKKPAPGACHLVCTVMKETCDRCAETDSNAAERRVIQRQLSQASCSSTSSFSQCPATNAIMRNSWKTWTIRLILIAGVAIWIVKLKAKLSASDERVKATTKAQGEEVATAADNDNPEHEGLEPEADEQIEVDKESEVNEEPEGNEEPEDDGSNTGEDVVHNDEGVGGDQPVAEKANRNKGPLEKSFNFIVGWTKDRLREMRNPHQA